MSVGARRARLLVAVMAACVTSQWLTPAIADPTPLPQETLRATTERGDSPDPLRKPGILWHRTNAKVPAPPSPPARAWLLLDSKSGDVLASSNARVQLPPASTLKTLTAVALMPRLDEQKVYTATSADVGIEGSGAGLVVGGTYSVRQLFIGLLLPSGNDAAMALTHVYNRDGNRAITLMNDTARRLGAMHTIAKSPNGLPRTGQVTTVADMALIGNAAVHLPMFRDVAHLLTYDFPSRMPKPGRVRTTYQLQNENPLIKHKFPGTLGGKTGYTREALRTYWGAANRGDRTLVVVIYGFVGTTYNYASNLLKWGFNNADHLTAVGHLPTDVGNHWGEQALISSTSRATAAASPAPAAPQTSIASASSLAHSSRTATTAVLFLLPAIILIRRALRYRRTRV